jgi:hypothetical protein
MVLPSQDCLGGDELLGDGDVIVLGVDDHGEVSQLVRV